MSGALSRLTRHLFGTHMTNKEKFESLLARCCLTQTRAAKVISDITQRPLSPRAVRAWLTDPTKPSFRSCPNWAIDALEEYERRPMVFDDEVEDTKDQHPSSNAKDKTVAHPDDLPIAPGIPYSMRELEAAFDASFSAPVKKPKRSPKVQQDYENVRYRCPDCKIQVWGAPNLIVGCITCDETMRNTRD